MMICVSGLSPPIFGINITRITRTGKVTQQDGGGRKGTKGGPRIHSHWRSSHLRDHSLLQASLRTRNVCPLSVCSLLLSHLKTLMNPGLGPKQSLHPSPHGCVLPLCST